MAAPSPVNPDTQVAVKISFEGTNRRYKLPLRDLGATTLPDRLRQLLVLPPTADVVFERYSDSAATFVTLDPNNSSVYKQLYRAAKAKLKLRIRATLKEKDTSSSKQATVEDEATNQVEQEAKSQPEDSTQSKPFLEQSDMPPSSLSDLQRGFEQLLINHPRQFPEVPFTSPFNLPAAPKPPVVPVKAERTEVPVTRGPVAHDRWFAEYSQLSKHDQTTYWKNACTAAINPGFSVYSVYCNNCNGPIPDAHFHCSTCDDGDFDLCQTCVGEGVGCGSEEHWLIKRTVKDGKVINSTTETLPPKRSFSESKTTLVAPEVKVPADTRTCNNCIVELDEDQFVTCKVCPDFDLCLSCHIGNDHGHHPKHAFTPATADAKLGRVAKALLASGRNHSHNAICDGCEKYIYGVRHKCIDCPDWDYCSSCIPNAHFIHPDHRFVPIYEALVDVASIARTFQAKARHHGIYCDGPLCNANGSPQTIIQGDRYKCAVCHDTDFCANCEASPINDHNKTHPLIKFKTAVRNVSVTTLGDHEDGKPMPVMGDRRRSTRTSTASTETNTTTSANAATQVQTVADLQPTEVKTEIKTEKVPEIKQEPKELPAPIKKEFIAHFVRDTVADGTVLPASSVFEQTWYLRNGGNVAWPAGCSVKFVGGDNMCAVDPDHPASVHELVSAAESTTCYTEVAPGQEVGFTVLMRTPARAGNFISYWRLTGPDGDKFGHRLWCDVHVKETPAVKEEPKETASITEPKVEGSQMIFPKLEKESPAASMHEPAPSTASTASVHDEAEEFEEFGDNFEDEETEDGFMTDEEYDVLDASDEEYLAEQGKPMKK